MAEETLEFEFEDEGYVYTDPLDIQFLFSDDVITGLEAILPAFTFLSDGTFESKASVDSNQGDIEDSLPSFSLDVEGGYKGFISTEISTLELQIEATQGDFIKSDIPILTLFLSGDSQEVNSVGDLSFSVPVMTSVITGDSDLPEGIQSIIPFFNCLLSGTTDLPDVIETDLPAIKASLVGDTYSNSRIQSNLPLFSALLQGQTDLPEALQFTLPFLSADLAGTTTKPSLLGGEDCILPLLNLTVTGMTDIIGYMGLAGSEFGILVLPSLELQFYPYDISPNIECQAVLPNLKLNLFDSIHGAITLPKFTLESNLSAINNSTIDSTFPALFMLSESGKYFVSELPSLNISSIVWVDIIVNMAASLPILRSNITGKRASQGDILCALKALTLSAEIIPAKTGSFNGYILPFSMVANSITGGIGDIIGQMPVLESRITGIKTGDNDLEAILKALAMSSSAGSVSAEVLRYVKERLR